MSYDKPNRIKHVFQFDAGNNGNETFKVAKPKGKAGRIWDYGIEGVTEVFTQDCTIALGDGDDADKYGEEFPLGALAADGAKSVRSEYDEVADKSDFDSYMVDRDVPADSDLVMTVVDDAASGIGAFFVIVDYDD